MTGTVPTRLLGLVLAATTVLVSTGAAPTWTAERFSTEAPLVADGGNVNGPSVIRVPDCLSDPLGRYYMYFADHSGSRIELAYADDVRGPWTIYQPGTLSLDQVRAQATKAKKPLGIGSDTPHIASPDVHVTADCRLRMYFHAALLDPMIRWGHESGVASSPDGINFTLDTGGPIADTYLRVFNYGSTWYAIDRQMRLLRSTNGITGWTVAKPNIFIGAAGSPKGTPSPRHGAVLIQGQTMTMFYSRVGDTPERIMYSTVELVGPWTSWKLSTPVELLRPAYPYEGSLLPVTRSDGGDAEDPVHQLRDPAILVDDGQRYLFYSVQGERGIAGAWLR